MCFHFPHQTEIGPRRDHADEGTRPHRNDIALQEPVLPYPGLRASSAPLFGFVRLAPDHRFRLDPVFLNVEAVRDKRAF
jgi:hypothetical protein